MQHTCNCSHSLSVRYISTIPIALFVILSSCFQDAASTLCEQYGRRCESGWTCAASQNICIPIDGCGDGITRTEIGENCDDGNINNHDACDSNCLREECGNSLTQANEECDPGSTDAKGCDSDCTFAYCGDGYANKAAGEECDSFGVVTADCNGPLCTLPECGDGFFNPYTIYRYNQIAEECDTGKDTQACNGAPTIRNFRAACKIPRCGDGYHNPNFIPPGTDNFEECDDGNFDNDDDCVSNCKVATCGDGFINPNNEECDTGLLVGLPEVGCLGFRKCLTNCTCEQASASD